MKKSDCYFIGYIAKTHGIKGEVSIKLDVDNANDYREMESVFLELQGKLVPFFIEKITIKDNNFASVKFEGVDTETVASDLIKTELFLPLSVLPPLSGNKFYYHEVIGFSVIDEILGDIGMIEDILEYPHQAVIQVKNKDKKEILIPIIDEIILSVERSSKLIKVSTPEGLVDLYISPSSNKDS